MLLKRRHTLPPIQRARSPLRWLQRSPKCRPKISHIFSLEVEIYPPKICGTQPRHSNSIASGIDFDEVIRFINHNNLYNYLSLEKVASGFCLKADSSCRSHKRWLLGTGKGHLFQSIPAPPLSAMFRYVAHRFEGD